MSAHDEAPPGTCLRNRLTGTTYVKTHRVPRAWLVIARGRADRWVTSAVLAEPLDLVPLVVAQANPNDTAREGT